MRYLALLVAATAHAADVCSNTQAIDGQQFPDWIKSGGSTRQLTGGGTRYKYGVAKVYALGLYIDEGTTTGALAKFAGKEGKQLAADQKFHDAVIQGKFGKTMLLQFHRAVGGEKVAEALKDSLSDKLDAKTLEAFKDKLFGVISNGVNKGTKLYFECSGGDVGISVDSLKAQAKAPATVCDALLKTYYGKAPVSAQAKEGMAHGFAALARGGVGASNFRAISTRVIFVPQTTGPRRRPAPPPRRPGRKSLGVDLARLGATVRLQSSKGVGRRPRVDGRHLGRAPAVEGAVAAQREDRLDAVRVLVELGQVARRRRGAERVEVFVLGGLLAFLRLLARPFFWRQLRGRRAGGRRRS